MQHLSFEEYLHYFDNDGFLIPKLAIECPLYRYRSNIDFVADEIINDHIYLAPLSSLNDPFDSSYAMSFDEALEEIDTIEYFLNRCYFLESKEWFRAVEERLSKRAEEKVSLRLFAEIVAAEIKNECQYYTAAAIAKNYYKFTAIYTPKRIYGGRVACFSEKWDSIPMWSYYADSHKGVCLKYDLGLLDKEEAFSTHIFASLQKVWYSDHRPIDKDGAFSPYMKGMQWAHEQEWRLFRKAGSEFVVLPCLTEIYLGVNFDPDKIVDLVEAIKQSPRKIKLFTLRPLPDTYGFRKIELIDD